MTVGSKDYVNHLAQAETLAGLSPSLAISWKDRYLERNATTVTSIHALYNQTHSTNPIATDYMVY